MSRARRRSRFPLVRSAAVTGLLGIGACGGGEDPAPQPASTGTDTAGEVPAEGGPEPTERGPFGFVDATAEAGLGGFRQAAGDPAKRLVVDSFGAGVALFDYDADGDLDAWLTNGTHERGPLDGVATDALYANDGNGRFTDVSATTGVADERFTNGVRVADLDGDGWTDVYLTNFEANRLYRNEGGERFVDVAPAWGLDDGEWSTGAAFLDHDRDGDLDVYVVNYAVLDPATALDDYPMAEYRGVKVYYGPRGLPGAADRFYRNDGSARFEDYGSALGIEAATGFGFDAVVLDADGDGWVDVYVANDSVPNYLWRNVEGGGFEERAFQFGLALSMNGTQQAGMGVAVGDWDDDLDLDLYVTNFAEDYFTFYRQERPGRFQDVTRRLGLANATYTVLGWGCGFFDFDLDGDQDLYAVNGHVYPQVDAFDLGTRYAQRNQLFENDGAGGFGKPEGVGGPGFRLERPSRGSAVGDVDGDGDLDVLIGNLDQAPTLLRNETPSAGHWFAVRLQQSGGNRDALGARIVARTGSGEDAREQLRWTGAGGSFLSTDGPWATFGLGADTRVEELRVTWPDGTETVHGPYDADQRVVVERP